MMKALSAACLLLFSIIYLNAQVRSTEIIFENRTQYAMYHNISNLGHGIWTVPPPQFILPDTVVGWKSESRGILTGTEGVIYFAMIDVLNGNKLLEKDLRVHWSNPYVGSNSLEITGPEGLKFFNTPIDGDNSVVRIVITDGGYEGIKPPVSFPRERLYFIDLHVKTADETDAGTDNDVYFSIGPYSWELASPTDDNLFERGDRDYFYLEVPDDVVIYADQIVFLQLEKKGDGGYHGMTDAPFGEWKVESIEIAINHTMNLVCPVNRWLSSPQDPYWRELLQTPYAADPNLLFFNSIRVAPNNPEVKGPTIACATTFGGKLNSISGWLNWALPYVECTGRTLWKPTYSADGLATIDIEISHFRIPYDPRVIFVVNRPMYIRIEYRMIPGCELPLPSLEYLNTRRDRMIQEGKLPGANTIVDVAGPVLWDTDDAGHFEIHPNMGTLRIRNY